MYITVLSNIPHYHYLAEALHSAGMLDKYITAPALVEDDRPPRWLNKYWASKMEGRRLRGIPRSRVHRLYVPEILQKALPRIGVLSPEGGNFLNNHLFDYLASRLLDGRSSLHFVSSVGLYSAEKCKAKGARIVCDVRQEHPTFQEDILGEEARRWNVPIRTTGKSYERRVLAEFDLADKIIVPSGYAKRTFVARGFAPDKISVNPYGVDLSAFFPDRNGRARRESTFRVLFAGSITPRKGVQYLLEAWNALRLPNAELLLVGNINDDIRPILNRFDGLFRHVPAVPKLQLRGFYTSCSVFVLPSLADSFSLATLEAMACGLPVIVSDHTGAGDVITTGQDGWVVPIRDSSQIADKLALLFKFPDLATVMGQHARATAMKCTWDAYAERALEFYGPPPPVHERVI